MEAISFRTITLRDMSGTVHIFPNGTVTTLANMTKDWSAYVMDIGVAYKEDTDRVVKHYATGRGMTLQQDPESGQRRCWNQLKLWVSMPLGNQKW